MTPGVYVGTLIGENLVYALVWLPIMRGFASNRPRGWLRGLQAYAVAVIIGAIALGMMDTLKLPHAWDLAGRVAVIPAAAMIAAFALARRFREDSPPKHN